MRSAARTGGRRAGLLAAAFLALTVLHLRDSHFFSVDISMTFFVMLTWLAALRMAERGDVRSGLATGLAFACAIVCKYTAVFMAAPIALAHLMSPRRPSSLRPFGAWGRWVLRGVVPAVTSVAAFLAIDPLVVMYYDKFRDDVRTQITEPLTGITRPIFFAHFFDLPNIRAYWFTNLLWWGMGPALEVVSLAGVVWLVTRKSKAAVLSAAVPIAYYVVAGRSVAPFVRYAIPLATSLTVAAGVLTADLWRRPRWRLAGIVMALVVLLSSAAYAAAYMNVYRQPDSRVAAARYLRATLPYGTHVLVEPSQNIPPIGSYFFAASFYRDYVVWGADEQRLDWLHLYGLDTYRSLYSRRATDRKNGTTLRRGWRRSTGSSWTIPIRSGTRTCPSPSTGVVKQYYRDLFAGRLGFELERTFKVYPSLFGHDIDDDAAELSFRLFDHPRVFVFKRVVAPGPR